MGVVDEHGPKEKIVENGEMGEDDEERQTVNSKNIYIKSRRQNTRRTITENQKKGADMYEPNAQ